MLNTDSQASEEITRTEQPWGCSDQTMLDALIEAIDIATEGIVILQIEAVDIDQ